MRAAEWQGWVVLGGLIVGLAALTWWLLFSPVRSPSKGTRRSPRVRQGIAVLVFASGASCLLGANWDELWHRQFGGFGNVQQLVAVPGLVAGAISASIGIGALVAVIGGIVFADLGTWVPPERASS